VREVSSDEYAKQATRWFYQQYVAAIYVTGDRGSRLNRIGGEVYLVATGPMPANKYTIVQIGVICFLIAIIGVRLVSQYPDWFNGEARKKLHTSTTQSAEPYERVLKTEAAH